MPEPDSSASRAGRHLFMRRAARAATQCRTPRSAVESRCRRCPPSRSRSHHGRQRVRWASNALYRTQTGMGKAHNLVAVGSSPTRPTSRKPIGNQGVSVLYRSCSDHSCGPTCAIQVARIWHGFPHDLTSGIRAMARSRHADDDQIAFIGPRDSAVNPARERGQGRWIGRCARFVRLSRTCRRTIAWAKGAPHLLSRPLSGD